MKNYFYVAFCGLLLQISAQNVFAEAWDSFLGCYETTIINGEAVRPAEATDSRILVDDAWFLVKPNDDKITSLNVEAAVQESDEDTTIYITPSFLKMDGASYTEENGNLLFKFNGQVKNTEDGELWDLSYENQIRHGATDAVEVIEDSKWGKPGSGDNSVIFHNEYTLKKKECRSQIHLSQAKKIKKQIASRR